MTQGSEPERLLGSRRDGGSTGIERPRREVLGGGRRDRPWPCLHRGQLPEGDDRLRRRRNQGAAGSGAGDLRLLRLRRRPRPATLPRPQLGTRRPLMWPAAALLVLAVAGCGGGNSSEQVTSVIPDTVPESASATTGPLGRICDKRLAHRVGEVIGARGFRGEFGRAAATGSE